MSTEEMKEMREALRATSSAVQSARTSVTRMANLMAYLVTARTALKKKGTKTVYEMVVEKQQAFEEEEHHRFWLTLQAEVLGLDDEFQPIEGKRGLLEKLGNWTIKNGLSRPEDVMSLCDFSGSEIDFELVLKAIFNACASTSAIEKCVVCLHETMHMLTKTELLVESEQLERESDDDDDDRDRQRRPGRAAAKPKKAKTKLQIKLEKIEDIARKQMAVMFAQLKKDQLFGVDIQRVENEKLRKRKTPTGSAENLVAKQRRIDVKKEPDGTVTMTATAETEKENVKQEPDVAVPMNAEPAEENGTPEEVKQEQ